MGKFNSETGKKAIKARWYSYEKKMKELHNHNPLLKAKLCGYIAGDGCLVDRKEKARPKLHGRYISFYPDHIELGKDFVKTFYKVYGLKPSIKDEGNYFRVRIGSKLAYIDLMSLARFSSLNWNIPSFVLNNKDNKIKWLRAFFDCEAYVGKKVIQLQSVNKEGLKQVKFLLKQFGIESKIYSYERKQKNWNINYLLTIMKKESRLNYLNKIGFKHPDKLKKLKEYLNAGMAQSGTAPDLDKKANLESD